MGYLVITTELQTTRLQVVSSGGQNSPLQIFATPHQYDGWLQELVSTIPHMLTGRGVQAVCIVLHTVLTGDGKIVSLGQPFTDWRGRNPSADLQAGLGGGVPVFACEAATALLASELSFGASPQIAAVAWGLGLTAAVRDGDAYHAIPIGHSPSNSPSSGAVCLCGSAYCLDLVVGGSRLIASQRGLAAFNPLEWRRRIEMLVAHGLAQLAVNRPHGTMVLGGPVVDNIDRDNGVNSLYDDINTTLGLLMHVVQPPVVVRPSADDPFIDGGMRYLQMRL